MAAGMFDDLVPAGQQQAPSAGLFDDIAAEPGFKAGDYIKAAVRGVQQVPGSLTGLADVPGALILGDRYTDKAADRLGDLTGFKPGQWANETQFSPGAQAEMQDLDTTWKKSGADRLGNALLTNHADLPEAWKQADLASVGKAIVRNPGAAVANVIESIPSMLVGGAIGKGLAVAGKVAPVLAGAAGEGAIAAGQNMDQTDRTVDPRRAAGSALAAGTIDALIAGGGGKLASKLGIDDVQTVMAGGRAERGGRGTLARIGGGAASEGVLQELPQSMQEQGWQNYAEGKPLGEGVIRQGVEGAIAGGLMGGGANVIPERAPAPAVVPRSDGQGDVVIDPAAGPLSAAAAAHVNSQQEQSPILTAAQNATAPLEEAIDPDQIGRENLAAWGQRANALPLEHAQDIAQEAQQAGKDLLVVEHPNGEGHTVVPREWLSDGQQQAVQALQPTPAGLFDDLPSTVDHAASQANTAPSAAQIDAGNYQKGHIKVGPLDIAIENPAGSTRTGPGWTTKMKDHYGYIKRTEGADGDQVDVYVKQGTPTDHTGPVFVVDQYEPATRKFDEHKAMIGYRFKSAAVKAYDAHFSDKSGPSRRQGVTTMSAEQFKDWAQSGNTQAPAATPRGWDGFEAGDQVTTDVGTTGTLHFDNTGTVAYVTPDTLAAGITNPDAGKTTAKAKGTFSVSPAEVSKAAPAPIQDFGEKIGGARKDTAQPTGAKPKAAATPAEVEPGWRKRFTPIQNMLRTEPTWNLFDTKTSKPVRGAEFKSEQAARDAIPMIAVAQKHRVVAVKDGFEIMRDVSDRKRVKVVDQIFPTRDEAMAHMAEHAQDIIETKTSFREELFARPEKVMREGAVRRTGPATAEDFSKMFGFRGVEFGNWNNQDERQEVMNHAYDGLLDLADVLSVPPKALSLNGELALAFGARGQGLSGAVAHYERNYGVINLTKMQGAGALAHEWMHAADHYFGRQDGKAKSEKIQNKRGDQVFETDGPGDYASHGLSLKSGMREELRTKYQALIKTLFTKAEQYVEDTTQAEKFVGSSRDALVKSLTGMRQAMEKPSPFGKRNNKPATAEQLADFDRLAADVIEGKAFELEVRSTEPKRGQRFGNIRLSNDVLDALSNLYKAVRGRSGMNAEKTGIVDGIRGDMRRYADRVKMLNDARTGNEKTKSVPTSYTMDAKRIDQGSATDYWTTPHEMAARAFSAYVEDKLPGKSDFLSYGSDNRLPEYRLFNVRPFPEGAERQAIGKAFDDFLGTMQTRETEKGIELYNQAQAGARTTAMDGVIYQSAKSGTALAKILDVIAEASTTPFYRQLAKLLLEKRVDARVQTAPADGAHGGAYDPRSNTIGLMTDADAERHLLHEAVHSATLAGLKSKNLAASQIRLLFEHAKRHLDGEHYGLSNVEEFVSEAFSNAQLQHALAKLPARPGLALRDAWHWFVRNIRQLIGLGQRDENLLTQVLASGVELMTPNAPNGKPSKLSPAQWGQVRTPEFKSWFGDWEKVGLRDFLQGQPVAELTGNEAPSNAGFKRLREWATALYESAPYNGRVFNPELGEVLMDHRSVRDTLAHGMTRLKAAAFAAVPQVLEHGRVVHSEPRNAQTDSFFVSAPVRIAGVNNIITALVHRVPSTQRLYLHSVTSTQNLLAARVSRADAETSERSGSTRAGGIHTVLHDLLTFKGDASKVLDENGEPLVVWHGSRQAGQITTFQPNELGLIWAASKRETAASYAGANHATAGEIPVFLNIRAPREIDLEGQNYVDLPVTDGEDFVDRFAMEAKRQGNDGAILRNLVDDGGEGASPIETAGDDFVVFDPTQLKHATQNRGAFDPTNADIRYSQAKQSDPDKLTVSDWINHQLANHRSWALGALTRDQLADIYGQTMPEVNAFDRVVQEMDQARNTIAEKADAIIERWRKLPAQTADTLASIMHGATLEQFDPDLRTDAGTLEQSSLLKEWLALSPEAQQLYRDVRDQYAATLAKLRNGLSKRAERAGAAGQRIAAEIRLQFDRYLEQGPYFPLARFGDFILIADKDGERIVEAFESSAAREKRARQLRVTGWKTKLTAKKGYSAAKDGPAGEFVGDVLKLVDGLEIEGKEKSALMDSLNQLAIGALPDQSYRRHFTHRKGTAGFSQDAMRAFASSMQHVAHHVARVLHGDELTLLLDSMNKRIAETTGDVDTTVQQQVANELAKRLDLMLAPNTHPVTALAGQVGFVMSLGGSVASGLTNLSQTPLITFPWLGAKFGFDKAAGALTKASKDYFGGRWDKWSGYVLKDNQAISADERRALQQLEDAGLINLTQTSDLASTATTDSASSQRSWAINRAMKVIGWTFSVPEVFNRQVSALAAYRLAKEKGQTHDQAVETALETLRRTHFDYSASNRSRWMSGNFTRVITMFKQYSEQMTYLLWRNAYQALKGESPAVRREARRMLLGVAAMHFSAAGALGLPLGVFGLSPLLAMLSMGMGSPDDPWDWEVELRKMLADTFGKQAGEAIARGPLRLLTNVDFASRVGLGDLWVRSPQGDKEGKDLVEAWMLTLLGPVAGYVGNLGTAAMAFNEGKYGRGLESMLPKMLAAPLKAARYENEGVKSWRGDDLGITLNGGDILGTALGFNPTKVAEMHEGQSAIKNRESALVGRREEIMNMFNAAAMAGDTEMQAEAVAAAAKFSMMNPSMAIRGMALQHSLQTKLRNQAMIKDGVYLAKRRQDLRAEGRFANVQ
jgi:hypothetical protein